MASCVGEKAAPAACALAQPCAGAAAASLKVAFLTGASKGIGQAIAVQLIKAGYHVYGIARTQQQLDETVAACLKASAAAQIKVMAGDVCDDGFVAKAIADCVASFGGLSVLVHNAAISTMQGMLAGKAALNTMDRILDVNLRAVMHVTAMAMPHLLKHGNSNLASAAGNEDCAMAHVVFISSLMAKQFAMIPGHSGYNATKHAVEGLAEGLWAEVRQNGVRVSTVYPGLVNTDMGGSFTKEFGRMLDFRVGPEQFLQPLDVAQAVLAVLQAPQTCNISELHVQPQRDLFRNRMFTEPDKLEALVKEPPVVPFRDRRVALITGAGRGIGKDIALQLAASGFDALALLARTQSQLEQVAAECKALAPGLQVVIHALDVADSKALEAAVLDTVKQCGTLSFIMSNAGVNRRKNVALSSLEIWEQVMHINLISSMWLTRLALPHLMRHAALSSRPAETAIIYNNTLGALPKQTLLPGTAIYATTKSGLAGFARVAFADVRDYGVKVSTIYPGLVNTALGTRAGPLTKKFKKGSQDPDDMIQGRDIAYAVQYVLSCSTTACPDFIRVNSITHMMPVIRKHVHKFVGATTPSFLPQCKL